MINYYNYEKVYAQFSKASDAGGDVTFVYKD
jgi:hypothetical protein